MILSLEEIKKIIKDNPNREIVDLAVKMQKRLSVHVLGIGVDYYLSKINNFENADQFQVRKKYARSNKDIIERITRPIDKVFSATGGSTFYDLPENKNQEFRNKLKNVENGISLKKWIEEYWKIAYMCDPMGIVFIEVDENGDAYPTYKSSSSIYDYKLNGRNLDYIVFKENTKDDSNRYRVIDNNFDYIIESRGEEIKIIQNETYKNYFGEVPAIICSNIPIIGSNGFKSPIENIVEIADEYLRENSVKSVYKLLHGFPKPWEYISECKECNGTGSVNAEICPSCKGTKADLKKDVSETRFLPIPDSNDAKIAPDIAGYTAPSIEAWSKMSEELKELESLMFETLWGTKQLEKGENDTATGKFIDTQPINDRLSKISESAETIEKFITDSLGFYYYNSSYNGSSINYGRRYQIESHDSIWKKYEEARKNGAPDTILDDFLFEYTQSKYENNSLELQIQLKLLEVEPFKHLSVSDVKSLELEGIDYYKKVYFNEFVSTLSDNEIIYKTSKTLRDNLTNYVTKKIIKNEKE